MNWQRAGFAARSPKGVAEKIHAYNKGYRWDKSAREVAQRSLRIDTYDLQAFSTNIPRAAFLNDLQKAIDDMEAAPERPRWF